MNGATRRALGLALACLLGLAGCDEEPCLLCIDTIAVHGQVVNFQLQPLSNVEVVLGSRSVVTDSDGRFQFGAVRTPYDLTILPDYARSAWTYRGLARTDPVLLVRAGRPLECDAAVRCSLSAPDGWGDGTPEFDMVLDLDGVEAWGGWSAGNPRRSYWRQFRWAAVRRTVTGRLHILYWNRDGRFGPPARYLAHAVRPLTLSDGEDLQLIIAPEEFVRPDSARLAGTCAAPDGYWQGERTLMLELGTAKIELFTGVQDFTDAFDFRVPLVAGASFGFHATAFQDGQVSICRQTGLQPTRTDLRFAMPEADVLIRPRENPTGIDSATVFAWDPGGPGIHIVHFVPSEVFLPEHTLVQLDTEARLPHLPRLRLGIPAGADYIWYVERVPEVLSMDDVVTREFAGAYAGGRRSTTQSELLEFRTRE
jgi:hypothetical protein